jgi:Type IV pili methyl-accepting chemotaxis transducer N-term
MVTLSLIAHASLRATCSLCRRAEASGKTTGNKPMNRRDAIRTLALPAMTSTLVALPVTAKAQVLSLNEAINKAGRQRMLSQRMAKAWLALGQGVESLRAEKVLADSMALFDRQFVELKAYAPTPEIFATYKSLESVWSDYKAALVGSRPDRSGAPVLLALDAKVLKLAHQGTTQLEQYSGKALGKWVNMAGRQRMLSQRSAKFYLSQCWGAEVPGALQELNKARAEFASALEVLDKAPEASTAIREELTLARQQWVFFDNALARLSQDRGNVRHATEVFASSENILKVMDQVTGMFSRLG